MWQEKDNKLTKTFSFENFVEALKFVNEVGEIAEQVNHHPDVFLHDYNRVTISTTTHDARNTVTEKDKELASHIDNI